MKRIKLKYKIGDKLTRRWGHKEIITITSIERNEEGLPVYVMKSDNHNTTLKYVYSLLDTNKNPELINIDYK